MLYSVGAGVDAGGSDSTGGVRVAVQYCLSLMQAHAPTVQLYAQHAYGDWPRCPMTAVLARGMSCAVLASEAAVRYLAAAPAAAAAGMGADAAAAAAGAAPAGGPGAVAAAAAGQAASSCMEAAVQLPFDPLHMEARGLHLAGQLSCLHAGSVLLTHSSGGDGTGGDSGGSSGSGGDGSSGSGGSNGCCSGSDGSSRVAEWQLMQASLSLMHTSVKLQHQGRCQLDFGVMYVALWRAFQCATAQDNGMDTAVWRQPQAQQQPQQQQQLQQQQQTGADVGAAPAALLLQPSLSATYAVLGRFLYGVGCRLYVTSFACKAEPDSASPTVGSSPMLAWLTARTTLPFKCEVAAGQGLRHVPLPPAQQSVSQAEALRELLIMTKELLNVHVGTAVSGVVSPYGSQLSEEGQADLEGVSFKIWQALQEKVLLQRPRFLTAQISEQQRRSTQMAFALNTLLALHARLDRWALLEAQTLVESLKAAADISNTSNVRWGCRARMAICIGGLGNVLKEIGGTLCTAMPNPLCCSNPDCVSLATASEGFALVRGQAVVWGGGVQSGGRVHC